MTARFYPSCKANYLINSASRNAQTCCKSACPGLKAQHTILKPVSSCSTQAHRHGFRSSSKTGGTTDPPTSSKDSSPNTQGYGPCANSRSRSSRTPSQEKMVPKNKHGQDKQQRRQVELCPRFCRACIRPCRGNCQREANSPQTYYCACQNHNICSNQARCRDVQCWDESSSRPWNNTRCWTDKDDPTDFNFQASWDYNSGPSDANAIFWGNKHHSHRQQNNGTPSSDPNYSGAP